MQSVNALHSNNHTILLPQVNFVDQKKEASEGE